MSDNSRIREYRFFTRLIILLIFVVIGIYVASSPMPQEGLELLWVLPVLLGIAQFVFWKEVLYASNSFALIILYATAVVRYVGTPLLIAVSGSLVPTINAGAGDYRVAIAIQAYELMLLGPIIRVVWPTHIRKLNTILNTNEDRVGASFHLTWTGGLFVVFLLMLLFGRGHINNVISHLSTWFYRVNNKDILYNYDMIAFNLLKTVLFLLLISLIKKWYDRSRYKFLPFIFALVIGLLNTMLYQYTERTDLFVLVFSTFYVLRFAFPKNTKFLTALFGVGGVLLVALIFMEGSMQYTFGSSVQSVDLSNYEKMAQLYTTGPSILANAHMNYVVTRSEVNLLTIGKDFVSSFEFLSMLPFLRFMGKTVSSGLTTVELYVGSIGGLSYILPNYSLACLYVSDIFGWLLEAIFIVLTVKLAGHFERSFYKYHNLAQIYAVINIVTMVSMGIFCNNFQLMIHGITSLPFWLYIFAFVNELGTRVRLKTN